MSSTICDVNPANYVCKKIFQSKNIYVPHLTNSCWRIWIILYAHWAGLGVIFTNTLGYVQESKRKISKIAILFCMLQVVTHSKNREKDAAFVRSSLQVTSLLLLHYLLPHNTIRLTWACDTSLLSRDRSPLNTGRMACIHISSKHNKK